MKKIIIKAPTNARYLSQIKDETGKDFELPNGILNKIIPNCGGTTLALENQHKTIVCSPRIELLRNKHSQYPNTLLVIGGVTDTEIRQYLQECKLPKVLTTYDSLSRLISIINDVTNWRVVVDEFQCVLSDGAFKSEIELKLLESLTKFSYVTYLSATPIIDKYLRQIPQFKNVPYYEIEWSDTDKVYIQRQRHTNPINAALEIVNGFKNGIYPYIEDDQGNRTYSTECVIFLNSVQTIVNIIKATGLTSDEVNIIVGSSADNDKLIAKLGQRFERGRIPLKGEQHKLVTFCTSTAYAGCDFYSTNASTFVISDCNRKNLAVDIATELVQIAGRQRLASNPFRNVITFIYRTNIGDYSETEFRAELTAKYESSLEEVLYKNNATGRIKEREISNMKKIQAIEKYSESFAMWSDINQTFEINQIAYLNEQYCYEVQRMNYRNGITIKNLIEETDRFELLGEEEYYNRYSLQLKSLISRESFEERMKNYIDARNDNKLRLDFTVECIEHRTPEIKYYYEQLGGAKIKALGYKECRIKAEINNRKIADSVPFELRHLLRNGEKVTNSFLKQTIQYVYDKLEMKKTAKATDIEKYLPLSKGGQKITDSAGHRSNGWVIRYD